jgi:hypothetical protein
MIGSMRRRSSAVALACTAIACTVGGDDEAVTFGTAMSTMSSATASASDETASEGGDESGAASEEGGSTGEVEQPEDGMYSDCLDAAMCVGLNACVTFPEGGAATDGYCTRTGCETAIADCAPAPGGSAGPTCIEVTIGMAMQMVCALDCSGGETCPSGMTCYAYGSYDICG